MRVGVGVAAASALLLSTVSAACSSTTGPPKTDHEQVEAAYASLRKIMNDRDADAFLELMCPHLRATTDAEGWFDIPEPLGDIESIKATEPPKGVDSPDATEWRKVVIKAGTGYGSHVTFAKIDGRWFLCEK